MPKPQQPEMPKSIDASQIAKAAPKWFIIDLVLDGTQVFRIPATQPALTLESLAAQLNIAVSANLPRMTGYNVYDIEGRLQMSVDAVGMLNMLGNVTPLKTKPADEKLAGFSAVPVVMGASEDFQKSIEEAKKMGRVPPIK